MATTPALSPLEALVTAEAYVILADKKALPEERAALVALLGKHLNKSELSSAQIQQLTADAFAYVARYEYRDFLASLDGLLSPAQLIAILANMYEAMIVDGQIIARERELIDEFQKFFEIDRRVIATVREVVVIKNDTTLFLRDDHPSNHDQFKMAFLDRMDLGE